MDTSIKEVLMRRDKMTAEEADDLIAEAKADLQQRIADGGPKCRGHMRRVLWA